MAIRSVSAEASFTFDTSHLVPTRSVGGSGLSAVASAEAEKPYHQNGPCGRCLFTLDKIRPLMIDRSAVTIHQELLNQARKTGAGLAEAERAALLARAEYHTAVRRLHLA